MSSGKCKMRVLLKTKTTKLYTNVVMKVDTYPQKSTVLTSEPNLNSASRMIIKNPNAKKKINVCSKCFRRLYASSFLLVVVSLFSKDSNICSDFLNKLSIKGYILLPVQCLIVSILNLIKGILEVNIYRKYTEIIITMY